MKDQKQLLNKCLNNDIPAIVFQGTDRCAIEILQAAEAIYQKNGCSPEFMKDFHENVVGNFMAYQKENSSNTKIPDLTEDEKVNFRILQDKEFSTLPEEIKDFEQHLKGHGFIQTYDTQVSHGKYLLTNERDYIGLIGKSGDYDFVINHNKETKQISYFVFSNDPQYPERVGDYNSFRNCYMDIMFKHPLQQKKSYLLPIIKEYQELGYDNISKTLEQYSLKIENISTNNNSRYTIQNIHIQNAGSKELTGDLTIYQSNNVPIANISNLRIIDKSNGKTEPLNIGSDIDINRQSSKSIELLLRGGTAEISTKSGATQMMGLSKSSSGWGLQAEKQISNITDISVGI